MKYGINTLVLLLLVSCTEKPKAIVKVDKELILPITCMKLDTTNIEKEFIKTLKNLYPFDKTCPNTLHLSYKKNIVCNSSYNAVTKSTGKFPRSFLKLELKKGFKVQYSYYIDLLDNVESKDVHTGFGRLKNDILRDR